MTTRYDPERFWAERYADIDLTKSGHADLPVEYNEWLYRRKKEILSAQLAKAGFGPSGASVLDIAVGTGVYVEMWRQLGAAKVSGVDISQNAVDSLAQRYPQWSFYKWNLASPGLSDVAGTGYTLVTALDMLYHIVDDRDFPVALDNLAATCRPGGYLAIHDFFMQHVEMDFGYIKARTLAAYEAALDRAGFDIVSRVPTFFLMVQSYDHRSLERKKSLNKMWSRTFQPFVDRAPRLAGRFAYYVDRALGSVLREGPSFEMMICRRR